MCTYALRHLVLSQCKISLICYSLLYSLLLYYVLWSSSTARVCVGARREDRAMDKIQRLRELDVTLVSQREPIGEDTLLSTEYREGNKEWRDLWDTMSQQERRAYLRGE